MRINEKILFKNLGYFLLPLIVFFVCSAQATTITRNVGPIETGIPATVEWDSDRSAGTAWIDVEIGPLNGMNNDQPDYEVHRIHLPGLSYNTDSDSLVYDDSGKSIVCAERTSSIFGPYLKETGNCSIDVDVVKDPKSYTGHTLILTFKAQD